MKFLITGASGLVGSALSIFLKESGHSVVPFNRSNPDIDFSKFDVLVHLAGENIGSPFWTKRKKQKILESRVNLTSFISNKLESLGDSSPYVISASAVGFYGTKTGKFSETSPKGEGFLSDVTDAWEKAWKGAEDAGVKVAKLRFGVILTPNGGALKKMLIPLKFGVALEDGVINWVSIEDVLALILDLSQKREFKGVINVSSGTSFDFSVVLARVLKKRILLKIPLRLLIGEMAQETLLSKAEVTSSYSFRFKNLEEYLSFSLTKSI